MSSAEQPKRRLMYIENEGRRHRRRRGRIGWVTVSNGGSRVYYRGRTLTRAPGRAARRVSSTRAGGHASLGRPPCGRRAATRTSRPRVRRPDRSAIARSRVPAHPTRLTRADDDPGSATGAQPVLYLLYPAGPDQRRDDHPLEHRGVPGRHADTARSEPSERVGLPRRVPERAPGRARGCSARPCDRQGTPLPAEHVDGPDLLPRQPACRTRHRPRRPSPSHDVRPYRWTPGVRVHRVEPQRDRLPRTATGACHEALERGAHRRDGPLSAFARLPDPDLGGGRANLPQE